MRLIMNHMKSSPANSKNTCYHIRRNQILFSATFCEESIVGEVWVIRNTWTHWVLHREMHKPLNQRENRPLVISPSLKRVQRQLTLLKLLPRQQFGWISWISWISWRQFGRRAEASCARVKWTQRPSTAVANFDESHDFNSGIGREIFTKSETCSKRDEMSESETYDIDEDSAHGKWQEILAIFPPRSMTFWKQPRPLRAQKLTKMKFLANSQNSINPKWKLKKNRRNTTSHRTAKIW